MARTVAVLSEGSRVTDYITLGVVAKMFPVDLIHTILKLESTEFSQCSRLPGKA